MRQGDVAEHAAERYLDAPLGLCYKSCVVSGGSYE